MRILQVINSLATGGAEKLLIESVPLFNKNGIQVDVLVLNGNDQPFLEKLKKDNCCKIINIGKSAIYNPLLILKIIPFLKKYDVIHVHLFPSLYWVAIAKMISFSKVKLIYTEHSTSNRRRNSKIFSVIDKIIYSQYNTIIVITQEVVNNLKKHLKKDFIDKFQLIQNGVNLEEIKNSKGIEKATFFDDEKAKIIIQVARFFEPKDQKTIIKSLLYLPKDVKLLLVGEGDSKIECENLAKSLNLQDRILFLGIRMDVLSLLKTADIIVLSSKHEGLSLSCIEGMASGKPFIASNVTGLKEVVANYGLLFPSGDAKMLANHISELLNDNAYYSKIANACTLKAKEYNINTMISHYIKLYEKIR